MISIGTNPIMVSGIKYMNLYNGWKTEDLNPVERLNSSEE